MAVNMKNIRIGEVLKSYGYITEAQLQDALSIQKTDRTKRLADILIDMGCLTEAQKLEALSKRLDIPLVNLDSISIDTKAVEKIP